MSDTQWPRYEVFKKDSDKRPLEAVGTVHASDPEIALLNARDVFVRRPSAVALWVVRESDILKYTAEELAHRPDINLEEPSHNPPQQFHLFIKHSQRRSMTAVYEVGQLTARTAEEALQLALAEPGRYTTDEIFVWWVVPDSAITQSNNDDINSLFAPAEDKTYRQQNSYGFVGLQKERRRSKSKDEG
jgi:ring-1,2-phenylacetyl-CoA epoxidase subunit PaaB